MRSFEKMGFGKATPPPVDTFFGDDFSEKIFPNWTSFMDDHIQKIKQKV